MDKQAVGVDDVHAGLSIVLILGTEDTWVFHFFRGFGALR
jgi:hypothetical protein